MDQSFLVRRTNELRTRSFALLLVTVALIFVFAFYERAGNAEQRQQNSTSANVLRRCIEIFLISLIACSAVTWAFLEVRMWYSKIRRIQDYIAVVYLIGLLMCVLACLAGLVLIIQNNRIAGLQLLVFGLTFIFFVFFGVFRNGVSHFGNLLKYLYASLAGLIHNYRNNRNRGNTQREIPNHPEALDRPQPQRVQEQQQSLLGAPQAQNQRMFGPERPPLPTADQLREQRERLQHPERNRFRPSMQTPPAPSVYARNGPERPPAPTVGQLRIQRHLLQDPKLPRIKLPDSVTGGPSVYPVNGPELPSIKGSAYPDSMKGLDKLIQQQQPHQYDMMPYIYPARHELNTGVLKLENNLNNPFFGNGTSQWNTNVDALGNIIGGGLALGVVKKVSKGTKALSNGLAGEMYTQGSRALNGFNSLLSPSGAKWDGSPVEFVDVKSFKDRSQFSFPGSGIDFGKEAVVHKNDQSGYFRFRDTRGKHYVVSASDLARGVDKLSGYAKQGSRQAADILSTVGQGISSVMGQGGPVDKAGTSTRNFLAEFQKKVDQGVKHYAKEQKKQAALRRGQENIREVGEREQDDNGYSGNRKHQNFQEGAATGATASRGLLASLGIAGASTLSSKSRQNEVSGKEHSRVGRAEQRDPNRSKKRTPSPQRRNGSQYSRQAETSLSKEEATRRFLQIRNRAIKQNDTSNGLRRMNYTGSSGRQQQQQQQQPHALPPYHRQPPQQPPQTRQHYHNQQQQQQYPRKQPQQFYHQQSQLPRQHYHNQHNQQQSLAPKPMTNEEIARISQQVRSYQNIHRSDTPGQRQQQPQPVHTKPRAPVEPIIRQQQQPKKPQKEKEQPLLHELAREPVEDRTADRKERQVKQADEKRRAEHQNKLKQRRQVVPRLRKRRGGDLEIQDIRGIARPKKIKKIRG